MNLLIFQEPVYTEAKSRCPHGGPGENQRKGNFLKIKNKKGDGKIK